MISKMIALTALAALILSGCNLATPPTGNEVINNQSTFEKEWAARQLESNPSWKPILEAYGVNSILDLKPNIMYVMGTDGRVTEQRMSSDGTQLQATIPLPTGIINIRSTIFPGNGQFINGSGSTSTSCFNSFLAEAQLDLEMLEPRGQRRVLPAASGSGNINASVNRNIDIINSGIGTYLLYGSHSGRCGNNFGNGYTRDQYYVSSVPA